MAPLIIRQSHHQFDKFIERNYNISLACVYIQLITIHPAMRDFAKPLCIVSTGMKTWRLFCSILYSKVITYHVIQLSCDNEIIAISHDICVETLTESHYMTRQDPFQITWCLFSRNCEMLTLFDKCILYAFSPQIRLLFNVIYILSLFQ